MQSMRDSFDEFQLVIEETIDAGDKVMLMAAVRGRGKESGAVVETPTFGWIWTLRGGKAVRVDVRPNRAEALEAAGLDA
jgi:ketosteroid isomerase-like protein